MGFSKFLFLLLISFSTLLCQVNPNSGKELDSLQTLLKQYIREKDDSSACITYYTIGKIYDTNGDLDNSNRSMENALNLAKAINDTKLIGRISNYLASNYSAQGKRKEAIKLYNQAYKMFEANNAPSKMAAVLINIGTEYVLLSDYKKAIDSELKALELKEKSKDSSNIAYYHLSLAELFFAVKDFDKWEKYLMRADKLAKNPNYASFNTQAQILNELGEYYRRKNNIKKAIDTFNLLYNLSNDEEYFNGMGTALSNLVPLYISIGDLQKAVDALNKSLTIYKKIQKVSGIMYDLVQLGTLNRTLKNYSASENYLHEALALSEKYNSSEHKVRALEELYLVNKSLGKYSDALNYYEKYSAERDSLVGIETQKQIAEIETKHETEKKETRIRLLNKENDLQKNELSKQKILIGGIIVTTILFAGLGLVLYRQKKTRSELQVIQAEHKMLRSQMNPHFIFNSLMAIQKFLFKNDSEKTADYLAEFAALMRMILVGSRSDKITLEEEIKISECYLDLQKMRFGNKFVYTINVDDNIDKATTFVPPMLIQPFIENAVEHGVRSVANNEGKIIVRFEKEDLNLSVTVEDNGPGIFAVTDQTRSEHVSYATQITKQRIAAIKKIYKSEIVMEIIDLSQKSAGQGTQIKFIFPNKLITQGRLKND